MFHWCFFWRENVRPSRFFSSQWQCALDSGRSFGGVNQGTWAWSKMIDWDKGFHPCREAPYNVCHTGVVWPRGPRNRRMLGHFWHQHIVFFGPTFDPHPCGGFLWNISRTDPKHQNSLWVAYGSNKQQGNGHMIFSGQHLGISWTLKLPQESQRSSRSSPASSALRSCCNGPICRWKLRGPMWTEPARDSADVSVEVWNVGRKIRGKIWVEM